MSTLQTLKELRTRLAEIQQEVDRLSDAIVAVQKDHDSKQAAPETRQVSRDRGDGLHRPVTE
jgi:hypothetical protein